MFSFGIALELMLIGKRVCRTGWNGKGMWVAIENGHNTNPIIKSYAPFIYMKTANNDYVPWTISQTDALARDWILFVDEPEPKVDNNVFQAQTYIKGFGEGILNTTPLKRKEKEFTV